MYWQPRDLDELWTQCLLWSPALAIARASYHYILRLFFFSRHTFSDVGKPTSPKLSHTTWLSIQQNLCYSDFFKVPLQWMLSTDHSTIVMPGFIWGPVKNDGDPHASLGTHPWRTQPFNGTCAVSLERVKLETSNCGFTDNELCDSHIVNSCPLTKLTMDMKQMGRPPTHGS